MFYATQVDSDGFNDAVWHSSKNIYACKSERVTLWGDKKLETSSKSRKISSQKKQQRVRTWKNGKIEQEYPESD